MEWIYQEYKLQGRLSEFINCIWWDNYSDVHPQQNEHFLVPDNSIELIFTDSSIKRIIPAFNLQKERKSQLCGLRTVPQICTVTKSPVICVRFIPKKFYRLCQINPQETIDNNIDPTECFGKSISDLEQRIFDAPSQQSRIDLIEVFFNRYLADYNDNKEDVLFEEILSYIEKTKGTCSIRTLSDEFNVSLKTIERKFKNNLGLTPKKYTKVIRFVDRFINTNIPPSDIEDSREYDFFDQAHFIKDVKQFSSLSPKKLIALKRGIQEKIFKKNSK